MKYLYILLLGLLHWNTYSQVENKNIDSIKGIITNSEEQSKIQSLRIELSNLYLNVDPDSSKHYLELSRPFLKKAPDSTISDWHMAKFALFLNKKQFDSAQYHIDRVAQYKDIKYSYTRSYYDNLGFFYYYKGEFKNARDAWQNAYSYAVKENVLSDQRGLLGKIAVCHQQLGAFQEGVETQLAALELAQKTKNKDAESRAYNNLGMLFEKLEAYDKAEESLLKAIKIDSTIGDKQSIASTLLNLGVVLRKVGDKNKDTLSLLRSKKHYEQALQISRSINFKQGISSGVTNMAILESSLGNEKKSITYGREAIKLNKERSDKVGELIARTNLAISLNKSNELLEAQDQLEKAIQLSHETGFVQGRQEALNTLSEIKNKKGDYKGAYTAYKNYARIKDSISSEEVKNKVNELEISYQTAQKEAALSDTRATLAEKELDIRKKNNLVYGLGGGAFLLALLGYLFYNQQRLKNRQQAKEFELKNALTKIETQNRLQEQRLRISRDLHDNIGSQLTFITSSLDNVKYGMKDNDRTKNKLTEIGDFTKTTINELRDTIWAMNKEHITFEDLEGRLGNLLDQARNAAPETQFSLDVDKHLDRSLALTSVEGMNVYRIIQEGVNNAIKYASASRVDIMLSRKQNTLETTIKDNGKGFDVNNPELGNGLTNMTKRAKDIDAAYTIESALGSGTNIKVILHYTETRTIAV